MNRTESVGYESGVNGYANGNDSSLHVRKLSDSDLSKERGYFARLSIEEKARQVNASSGRSDFVRESVTSESDSEGPYNSFRRLSMTSSDGQTDARKAAKQMYAEFSFSPNKRSAPKYTPPSSTEGLQPRKRDHEIRVIPKTKQSTSVTQLKGMFDHQKPASQQRLSRSSQSDSRVRRDSENDILDKPQVRNPEPVREDDSVPEDLATRKARFEQAEALFRRERKAPPPPVKLTELINKDKPDDRASKTSPTDRMAPTVPPKPVVKRFSGHLERNIDLAAARQNNVQTGIKRNEKVNTANDTDSKISGENKRPKGVNDSISSNSDVGSKERRFSDHKNEYVRRGSDNVTESYTSRAGEGQGREPADADVDRYRSGSGSSIERHRRGSGTSIDRHRSSSGGVPDGVDIHQMRRKMPPRRASSSEFQGLEENVEVYGKKPIDISAILGLSSSSEKIEEEKELKKDEETTSLISEKETSKSSNSTHEVTNPVSPVSDEKINVKTESPQSNNEVFVKESVSVSLSLNKEDHSSEESKSNRLEELRARKNSLEKRKAFLLGGSSSIREEGKPDTGSSVASKELDTDNEAISVTASKHSNSAEKDTKLLEREEETVIEDILEPTTIEPVREIPLDFSQFDVSVNGETTETKVDAVKKQVSKSSDIESKGSSVVYTSSTDYSVSMATSNHTATETTQHDGKEVLTKTTLSANMPSSGAESSQDEDFTVGIKVEEGSKKAEEHASENLEEAVEDLSDVLGAGERITIQRQYSHEPPMDEVSMSHEGLKRSGSCSSADEKMKSTSKQLTKEEKRDQSSEEESEVEEEEGEEEQEGEEEEEGEEGEAEEEEEEEEQAYYNTFSDQVELPPPPERSCLSNPKLRKQKRNVVIQDTPSSVIFTYGPMEYDRGNPEIDPVTASAEWELEKRVDNMDIFSVDLDKDERGLGLSIIGLGVGTESGVEKLGIFVKSLTDGGSAQRDGRIEVKDQILEVNGTSLVGVTQQFAAKTLKETRGSVRFLMGREKSTRHYNFDPEYDDSRQLIKELEQRHNEEISELFRRSQEADDRALDAEQTLEAVRIELCEAEERAHLAESNMEELRNELDFLKSKPQDAKKTEKIDHLQKLLQEISEKLAASEGRLTDLHQENVDKQGELQSLKEKLQETEREYEETVQKSEQLSALLDERNRTAAGLTQELEDYKRQVTEITSFNSTQKQHILKLEQEVTINKAASHENKLRIATLEKREAEYLLEIKRLKMENENTVAKADNRDEELRKLAEERSLLQKEIEELESGHEELKNVHNEYANKEEEYKKHIRMLEEKLHSLDDAAVKAKQDPVQDIAVEKEVNVTFTAQVESQPDIPHLRENVEEVVSVQQESTVESEAPAPTDTSVPKGKAPSQEPIKNESNTTYTVNEEKKDNDVKEITFEVQIPSLKNAEKPAIEPVRQTVDTEVQSSPATEETAEVTKSQPEGQGGLIEFQYKPGGPFFPDLSDMPETVVDSPSGSESEEEGALDKGTEGKESRSSSSSSSSSSDAGKKPGEVRAASEEVAIVADSEMVASEEPSVLETKKIGGEAEEAKDDVKELEGFDAPTRAERSSFLESLRENPSFKAWLDEEWNIVSNKVKEDEAEKIVQQVMESSPIVSNRSERENEAIIMKRSGSAKLDESYFHRTVVEQESLDVRPKLFTQDSQELTESTDEAAAEGSDATDFTETPEPPVSPEPISFDVPDTEVLNVTPQLDKLRIARERSHRKPSTPKNAITPLDLGEEVPSSKEEDEERDDAATPAAQVEEEKKERKVAEVQPMMANQLLFKELAAAAASRPAPREEPTIERTEKPQDEPKPILEETHEERSQPIAERESIHPDLVVDAQRDHKSKHKLLGIKLPKIPFGSKRKSQDFNLDVNFGESSGKATSPVLTSERVIADKPIVVEHNDHEDGIVPLGSKENLTVERQADSGSTDEAVVPFAEKVASGGESTENLTSPATRYSSDNAIDSAGASEPSSGAVSPAEERNNMGSQDSLDDLGSGGEEKDLPDKSFSALDWMQKSVNEWDTRQVGLLMVGMGLDQYVDTFHNKGVNGPEFITLNGSKLKDLGVSNPDHRAAIKKKVKELKALEKEKNKHKDQKKDGKSKDGRISKGFWKSKYTLN